MAIGYDRGAVTQDGWFVSRTLANGVPAGGRISVSRGIHGQDKDGWPKWRNGDHDGREFETDQDCEAFLRSHGYLQPHRPSVGVFKAIHRADIQRWNRDLVLPGIRAAGSRSDIVRIADELKHRARFHKCDILDSLCFSNGVYAAARRLRPELFVVAE